MKRRNLLRIEKVLSEMSERERMKAEAEKEKQRTRRKNNGGWDDELDVKRNVYGLYFTIYNSGIEERVMTQGLFWERRKI